MSWSTIKFSEFSSIIKICNLKLINIIIHSKNFQKNFPLIIWRRRVFLEKNKKILKINPFPRERGFIFYGTNIFSRLDPAIKEARDKLGPYIYTKRVSSSLGWVLMKSCSGKWYFGQWNKKTRVREGVGVYADNIKIYEGYWRNGKAHWRGRRINIDGNYYEGNFQDYEYHGNGLYRNR